MPDQPLVLILTPVKDAIHFLDGYFSSIANLDYPPDRIAIGILESDSRDGTYESLLTRLPDLHQRYRRVGVWKRDYGFIIREGMPRYEHSIQVRRRSILAKSRNQLLFRALQDEDWVLWLDVDVIEYPPDLIPCLLETQRQIVHPHCVREYGGRTFDLNAWRENGSLHMEQLRSEGSLVPLDSVGGTALWVNADCHRDGLIFPSYPYGIGNNKIRTQNHWLGEIETEGFGIMAHDMGIQPWGMPLLEIKHSEH
ncbi:MAG: hypothetical protein AAGH88_03430 [Planctomycetota bacterium]